MKCPVCGCESDFEIGDMVMIKMGGGEYQGYIIDVFEGAGTYRVLIPWDKKAKLSTIARSDLTLLNRCVK